MIFGLRLKALGLKPRLLIGDYAARLRSCPFKAEVEARTLRSREGSIAGFPAAGERWDCLAAVAASAVAFAAAEEAGAAASPA